MRNLREPRALNEAPTALKDATERMSFYLLPHGSHAAQGQLISLDGSTLPGKLDHIEAAGRSVFESIKLLTK